MTREKALRKVVGARVTKEHALKDFEESIFEAHKAGCSLREIEKVAGISNVTVMKMVRRNVRG